MAEQESETLLEFPCEFAIKAMGPSSEQFELIVVDIVSKHTDGISEGAVAIRQSSGGKFTSVTVTFNATSKAQLDALYTELSAHEHVKYVL